MRRDFEEAEKLHNNFYDVTHTTAEIVDIIPAVRRLVNRAFRLLPADVTVIFLSKVSEMATITFADDAVNAVDEFLAEHYRYRLPVSAKRKGEFWQVIFDVGALRTRKLELALNTNTGSITGFSPPTATASKDAANVRRHIIHSRRYFDKALTALEKRDAWESGKLLWRSVEQAFLGAAASQHYTVKDRRDLNAFIRQYKDDPGGEQLNLDFRAASLGEGFQAIEPEVHDIETRLPQARRALSSAFAMMPSEIASEVQSPGLTPQR